MKNKLLLPGVLLVAAALTATAQTKPPSRAVPPAPHLETRGRAVQLIVDGQPFLVLGGELHNSSASSLAFMRDSWARMKKAHLNTVLAPVYWELTEPREGSFDFRLVDGMLQAARAHGLHLILLWFGSWKNGQSTYAPAWVKHDPERFPLVEIQGGYRPDILSPFCTRSRDADAAAFGRLMAHLKQVDGRTHTVLMVQVENEVGLLGDSRDRSAAADSAFSGPVPAALIGYLQRHKDSLRPHLYSLWKNHGFRTRGSWTAVFGKGSATAELCMAWQYARYVEAVARAGKAAYPLPMYVNAWIVQPGDKGPGDYPGGGPQAHVHDIWKAAAPDIDMLCPDIYLPGFARICSEYREPAKGFFIPESRAGEQGAAQAFYAIGAAGSIGYSPFGIDGIAGLDTGSIFRAYDVLGQLAPLILKARQQGEVAAVLLNASKPARDVRLGDCVLKITLRHFWDTAVAVRRGYCLVIATAPDTYFVAGNDFQIAFTPASGKGLTGFDAVEEGTFKNGKWSPGRRLNGDGISGSIRLPELAARHQTGMVVRVADGPAIRRVKVYPFP